MIDNYTVVSITIRVIAMALLLNVISVQIRLFVSQSDSLKRFRGYLTGTVLLAIAANALTIAANYYRQGDGNLTEDIRHISQIFNACSILATAVFYYLIYNYRDDE